MPLRFPFLHAASRGSTIAAAALAGLLFAAGAHAEVFTFRDWVVSCDNTRNCEAVGYQSEHGTSDPVAIWIARDAGNDGNIRGRVNVQSKRATNGDDFSLLVGKLPPVTQVDGKDLDAAGFRKLLPAMLESDTAEVRHAGERFTLSLDGFKAAMLKIDDLQGRIGTRNAIARKGTRSGADVPPELPPPPLHAAVAFRNKSTDDRLLHVLLPLLKTGCTVPLSDGADGPNTEIHRVSATQVIVLRECHRLDWQSDYAAWLVDDRPPYGARRLQFPRVDEPPADTVITAEFDGPLLRSIVNARREGDCGGDAFWGWTGTAFELEGAHAAPLCRGFAGGGYTVQTYETKSDDD